MGDLRIGTATSAPAAGTLKIGSTDISKIYSGSTLVWPTSPDPYVPPVGSSPRFIARTSVAPYFSLVDQNLGTVTPPVTLGSLPSNQYAVTLGSSNMQYLYAFALGISGGGTVYRSADSGASWNPVSGLPILLADYARNSISRSGQYINIFKFNQQAPWTYYRSNDYGASFSIVNLPYSLISVDGSSTSSGGKYMYITIHTNTIQCNARKGTT